MKKKILFISVIVSILLIGIAIAGVISKSRVIATAECTCTNRSGGSSEGVWEPVNSDGPASHHQEKMRCDDCGKYYYNEPEDHDWSGDAFPASETGYHNVQCLKCSTTNLNVPCEYTKDPAEYDTEQHIIYCICGQYVLKTCTWEVGEGNQVYHNLECECGNTSQGSHNWSNGVCVDTSTDKGCGYVCQHEEKTVTETITEATCVSGGTVYEECDYCDLGGPKDTEVDPDNHIKWSPATCMQPETCECGAKRGTTEAHSIGYCGDNQDNETHTNYCTNSGCGYSEPEDHYNNDGDNLCDACDYVMSNGTTHDCVPKDTYESDENQHWKVCKECGEKIGTVEKHYISGGQGIDNNNGTHTGKCKVCEADYTEAHTDEDSNNECDICNYQMSGGTKPGCEHTNTTWGRTETEHWEVCVACGEEIPETRKTHSYTDGKCECGRLENANTCKHTNPVWDRNQAKHWKVCVECGEKIEGTEESHSYANGKCECGRMQNTDTCNHTNVTWGRSETEHWKVCIDCGKEVTGTRKAHSYTNGKCECGKLQNADTCKHTNKTWGRTATEHWEVCIECGKEISGTRTSHKYTNGKCECGRLEDSKTCEHKNKEWKSDKDEHWQVCKDCGEEIEGTRDNHTYDEDKCKDCGTDKDSSTSGKDIPDTGSKPVVIGIVSIIAIMGMSIIGIKKYKGI